jgi:hypothetical protein
VSDAQTHVSPAAASPQPELVEISAARRTLHAIEQVPLAEAAARLDEVHGVLQTALSELDRS